MAGVNSRMPFSSTEDLIDESGDPNAIYSNFLNVVNKTQKKLVEMNDTVSNLNCKITVCKVQYTFITQIFIQLITILPSILSIKQYNIVHIWIRYILTQHYITLLEYW